MEVCIKNLCAYVPCIEFLVSGESRLDVKLLDI